MLQACLNGSRDKAFHAYTPFTAAELASDAAAAIAAGATELHIHPRDATGNETLDATVVREALEAIRARVPGTPIGLSTHERIAPGGAGRLKAVESWKVLPDYVSINLIEDDAPEMIALAMSKGIGVEAGLWSAADAERLIAAALPAHPDRDQRAGRDRGAGGGGRHPRRAGPRQPRRAGTPARSGRYRMATISRRANARPR